MTTIFDERDFRLGDSLVKAVFDAGISASDAVLLLISKNTIARPWVREEMDAAVTQMLAGKLRVIPVVLDGVDVPPPIQHRIYLRVAQGMTVDDVADRVALAIFGRSLPEIGPAPPYAAVPRVPGLANVDVFLFAFIVSERLRQTPAYPWVETQKILAYSLAHDIPPEVAIASLYAARDFLEETTECGTALPTAYAPTSFGVEQYLISADPTYGESVRQVVSAIVNDNDTMADDIVRRTGLEPALVEVILDNLARRRFLELDKYSEGVYVTAAPTLGRLLE